MQNTVFYSWQRDLPNKTNRGFIQDALEKAAKTLREDDSVDIGPVIDRDTLGVPGSPDISSTIFDKIDRADAVVFDVSIINAGAIEAINHIKAQKIIGESEWDRIKLRPTPNANVLIELGYAIKSKGPDRIIMVCNTAFGDLESLPFDFRGRRVVPYYMLEETEERATEKRRLHGVLTEGLRTILEGLDRILPGELVEPPSVGDQATSAVNARRPDQVAEVRRFMEWLAEQIKVLAPRYDKERDRSKWDEMLVQAISHTAGPIVEFARLGEATAKMNAVGAAQAMYKGLAGILEQYRLPAGISGSYNTIDFDFAKFVGHELVVIMFYFLMREEQWTLIADLLDEDIYVENAPSDKPDLVPFSYASQNIGLLEHRNSRLNLGRTSLHADLLKERHDRQTGGALAELVPMAQFIETDYFLYLRGVLRPTQHYGMAWAPWSTLYLQQTPSFLVKSLRAKYAEQLLKPLGVPDLQTFRSRFTERVPLERNLFSEWRLDNPFGDFDPQRIGTR